MDYTGQKFLQNCGDYLIIDKKSDKKERTRFLWEAHFEGYSKKLYVRQDNFSKGNVHNPEKPDKYGFLCDEEYIDKKDKAIINATIIVERDSLKSIIIGKQGAMLKEIGSKARCDIENMIGKKVFLELYVKTIKNWRDKEKYLRELGFYDIDE